MATVYRVDDIENTAYVGKVRKNGMQLHLTGVILRIQKTAVIVVEGGAGPTRKFDRLVMHRIPWQCRPVFQGAVTSRRFTFFGVKIFRRVAEVREYMEHVECLHLWEAAVASGDTAIDDII